MHDFLTTKELADYLRVKERKVYDMAASGEVPCTKAMGKLLFSRSAIDAWLAANSVNTPIRAAEQRPLVFLGSHDPLLEWALREAQTGMATYFDSSVDGLQRMLDGGGAATGLHLFDPATSAWNLPTIRSRCSEQPFALMAWARRSRGFITAPSKPRPATIADLPGRTLAARQAEAGSQQLLEHLLAQSQIEASAVETALIARSEQDAALAVASGQADVCFGLASVAQQHGLSFTPIIEEQFDILFERRAWFEPQMQTLLAFVNSTAFTARAGSLDGYDVTETGKILWNGP